MPVFKKKNTSIQKPLTEKHLRNHLQITTDTMEVCHSTYS